MANLHCSRIELSAYERRAIAGTGMPDKTVRTSSVTEAARKLKEFRIPSRRSYSDSTIAAAALSRRITAVAKKPAQIAPYLPDARHRQRHISPLCKTYLVACNG